MLEDAASGKIMERKIYLYGKIDLHHIIIHNYSLHVYNLYTNPFRNYTERKSDDFLSQIV